MIARWAVLMLLLVTGLAQTACSGSAQPAGEAGDNNGAIAVLVVLALIMVVVWLWQSGRRETDAVPATKTRTADQNYAYQPPAAAPVRPQAEAPARVVVPSPASEAGVWNGPAVQVAEPPVAVPVHVVTPQAPDDLKLIEGIGPKIAGLLQTAGIATFAQLAAADVERLRAILAQAGLARLADPGTWPEQARLAADGDWTALKTLQDSLKGGRRA